jgi:hypothetical protein
MKSGLVFLLLAATMTLSAQTVSRKVALTKGQQLEQLNQVDVNITQEVSGQMMEIKMKSTITNLVEVKDQTPNGFAVSNTVKRVLMNMNMMGQDMNFDSDKKEDMEGQMGQAYKDKVGKPRDYSLSKDGIVTEVKGAEVKAAGEGMMDNMMNGVLADEKVGSSFNALVNIPVKGIKVGETWSDSTSEGGAKTFTTYTLKELRGDSGIVTLNSDMSISREIEQQGMTMQLDMKGNTIGEYSFDPATGVIRSRKATTKANGTVDVMGQSVPMTMETTMVSTTSSK